jgi:hypothetical protein
MLDMQVHRPRQRGGEVAVSVPNCGVAPREASGGMIHRFDAVGHQVERPPGVDERTGGMREVGSRVLVLAAQEPVDDRALGILMADGEPAAPSMASRY